jgi:hypothetical protein
MKQQKEYQMLLNYLSSHKVVIIARDLFDVPTHFLGTSTNEQTKL